jgi:hypothetical protein
MGALSHGPRPITPLRLRQTPRKSEALAERKQPDFPIGATISDRAMSGLSRSLRFAGQAISKERYAKGVKSGAFAYHPKTIRRLKRLEFHRAVIDQHAPQMKPRDRQLIYEWLDRRESGVMHPASEEGSLNRRFKQLFAKYEANGNADALREMLGSEGRQGGQDRVPRGLASEHRRQRESFVDAGHAQGLVRRYSGMLERRQTGLCF